MPDREKVIKGLEHCFDYYEPQCEECPYRATEEERMHVDWDCHKDDLHRDVLELLKEKEPVMPRNITDCVWSYSCGECKKPLYARGFVYCPWCGRKVKWDD